MRGLTGLADHQPHVAVTTESSGSSTAIPRRARTQRSRPSHAQRNDSRIHRAALAVLDEVGWDRLSINRVAKAADLSNGALLGRFPDASALGLSLWADPLRPALTHALATAFDSGVLAADAADPVPFLDAMGAFVHPSAHVSGALDLILGSRFDPALRPGVADEFAAWLRAAIGDADDPARAPRIAAIATWAFGLILFRNRPWLGSMDITPALRHMHRALQQPARPGSPPAHPAQHLHASPFDTGDPRIDEVLQRTLASIGDIGYRRTRLRDIAESSGTSEGLIFSRYPTKLDVFLAINRAGYAQAYAETIDYQRRIADTHGPGLAEAALWREYLNPAIVDRQVVGTETDRLSLYDPRMRDLTHAEDTAVLEEQLRGTPDERRAELTGYVHVEFASGHGLPVLGQLVPDAHALPLNVILEPYLTDHPLA
ncbi:MAG: TetR/AcrR family transcriptional regulator [Actinomycetales bacterium]|nr:TetR/AcrR family transcriptional regulator [Actinomycetales bacterium]